MRPYKGLSPDVYALYMSNKIIDNPFLHCHITFKPQRRLFQLIDMDWVMLESIEDVICILF